MISQHYLVIVSVRCKGNLNTLVFKSGSFLKWKVHYLAFSCKKSTHEPFYKENMFLVIKLVFLTKSIMPTKATHKTMKRL